MWQKLVHAFTRGIDSTLRCLRTILSCTLNNTCYKISMDMLQENALYVIPFEKISKREIDSFRR